jgi:hypothetical protein
VCVYMDAHDTLGRSNFMHIPVLLILARGARPLRTPNCGQIMSIRLFNSAFDDVPKLKLNFVCVNILLSFR